MFNTHVDIFFIFIFECFIIITSNVNSHVVTPYIISDISPISFGVSFSLFAFIISFNAIFEYASSLSILYYTFNASSLTLSIIFLPSFFIAFYHVLF